MILTALILGIVNIIITCIFIRSLLLLQDKFEVVYQMHKELEDKFDDEFEIFKRETEVLDKNIKYLFNLYKTIGTMNRKKHRNVKKLTEEFDDED